MQKPICLAPWRALSIRPNGQVLPDGQFERAYGNINNQSLEEIFYSEVALNLKHQFSQGNFSSACQSCQKKEKTIGHSRRIFFEDKIRKFNPPVELSVDEKPDIQYLDLNLSNKCNLRCRMCSSHSSSAWIPEEKKLLQREKITFRLNKNPQFHRVDYDKVVNAFSNPCHFRNLKFIALQGGEPLLEERNLLLLQKFVDWGIAKNVTIELSTNGTIISSQIVRLIESFKQIDLYISIEACGELYKYIRGGPQFSIEDLERNIIKFRKIPKLNFGFAVTTSIYNILYLKELLDWFDRIREPQDEIVMSNTVVRPEYLSFQILPRVLKQKAFDKLCDSQVIERMYSNSAGPRRIGNPGLSLIRESLQTEIYSPQQKKEFISQFLDFNDAVDSLRGTTMLDVLPELSMLYNESQLTEALAQE